MKNKKKIIIFVSIMVLFAIIERRFNLLSHFTGENFENLRQLVDENIFLASLVYIAITVVGSVLLALPGVTFAILAGAMFGPILGTFLCTLAATVGAIGAFFAGRYFLKDSVKPMIEKNEMLKKLLFSDNKNNAIFLLMITRLVPIFPYNLQNFAYGITDINPIVYSVATFVFLIPGSAMFTFLSSGLVSKENANMYYMIAVVIAIVVFIFGYFAKKYLSKGV